VFHILAKEKPHFACNDIEALSSILLWHFSYLMALIAEQPKVSLKNGLPVGYRLGTNSSQ
jgi:hypothetical protein